MNGKKRTHEEFVEEMKLINPDIEILGTFTTTKAKILVRCKIDGYEWEVQPNHFLRGGGCPKCKGVLKYTTDSFKKKIYELNPNLEILEEYVSSKKKIKTKCLIDGHIWNPRASHLLEGSGCPVCKITNRRKTQEQFISEMKDIHPNIEVVGTYINTNTKIKLKCKIDNHEWEARPYSLLYGYGCPKCGDRRVSEFQRKSHDKFISEMETINPNIEIIGNYINNNTKILCKCKIDGNVWMAAPLHLLEGKGCPICANRNTSERMKQTQEEFEEKLYKVNPYVIVLGEYKGFFEKILVKCKRDGCEWSTTPCSLMYGHGCPKCNLTYGERKVLTYLENNNIENILQHRIQECKNERPLPFDFYLPEYNACIEYQGIQHYEPVDFSGHATMEETIEKFKIVQLRDKIKYDYCLDNCIPLLTIPYTEFDNIDNIIEDFLKNIQGLKR